MNMVDRTPVDQSRPWEKRSGGATSEASLGGHPKRAIDGHLKTGQVCRAWGSVTRGAIRPINGGAHPAWQRAGKLR